MIITLGAMSYYYFVAADDTVQVINDFCNFKPISFVITFILALFNYFTISNFYNWHYNPSFVVNKKEVGEKFLIVINQLVLKTICMKNSARVMIPT